MNSFVIEAFRNRLDQVLPADIAEQLRQPIGGGPDSREVHRALLLADRAARDWLAGALAALRQGAPNQLEQLPQLGRPEAGAELLQPAGAVERHASADPDQAKLGALAEEIGWAINDIDTEASVDRNLNAFERVSEAGADSLIAVSRHLGGDEFLVSQANQAMKDLIALDGWMNQLGPRFQL